MSKYEEFIEKYEELADLRFACDSDGKVIITKRQAKLIFNMFVIGAAYALMVD